MWCPVEIKRAKLVVWRGCSGQHLKRLDKTGVWIERGVSCWGMCYFHRACYITAMSAEGRSWGTTWCCSSLAPSPQHGAQPVCVLIGSRRGTYMAKPLCCQSVEIYGRLLCMLGNGASSIKCSSRCPLAAVCQQLYGCWYNSGFGWNKDRIYGDTLSLSSAFFLAKRDYCL